VKCAQCQPDNPPDARFCLGGGAHLTHLPAVPVAPSYPAAREKRRMLEEERRDLEEIATRGGFGSPDNTMRGHSSETFV